jgi:eukaryotic translation initiation factor 2-alpha kinase 4
MLLKGINARCVGLSTRDRAVVQPLIKLSRVDYFTRIIDLHKSNPIKMDQSWDDDWVVPEGWQVPIELLSPSIRS